MSLEDLLDSPDAEWRDISHGLKKFLNKSRKQAVAEITPEEANEYLRQEKERLNYEVGKRIFTNKLPNKKEFKKKIKHLGKNGDEKKILQSYETLKAIEEGNYVYHPKVQDGLIEILEKTLTEERMENMKSSFKKKTETRDHILLNYLQERAKQILPNGGTIKHNLYTMSESKITGEVKTKLALTDDTIRGNVKDVRAEIKHLYMTEKDMDTLRSGFSLKYKFPNHKQEEVDLMAAVNYFTFLNEKGEVQWVIKSRIKRNEDNMLKHIHHWLGIRGKPEFYDTTGTIELAKDFKMLYDHLPLVKKKSHKGRPEIVKYTPSDLPERYDEGQINAVVKNAKQIHEILHRTGEKPTKEEVNSMLMQIQVKKFYHNIKMENNLQLMDLHNDIYMGPVIGHDKFFLKDRREKRAETERINNLDKVTDYLKNKFSNVFVNAA